MKIKENMFRQVLQRKGQDMIFGHIPAAMVTGRTLFKRYYGLPALLALSFLPDLFDKNLFLVFGLESRGYFHSLLAALGLSFVILGAAFIWPGTIRKTVALQAFVFYVLHICCDVVGPKTLFWPFDLAKGFPVFAPEVLFAGKFSALEIMERFYLKFAYPWWLGCEAAFLAVCLALLSFDASRKKLPAFGWVIFLRGCRLCKGGDGDVGNKTRRIGRWR